MAMMTWMRWIAPYLLAAVLVTFLGSLAYFGGRGLGQDQGVRESVVTVNGEGVSVVAYQHAYRATVEQYRQMLRERFSEELLRSLGIQQQVLDRLVTERLIAQRAAAEGIVVSDGELADQITRLPAFQEGGRFSRERYLRALASAQPPLSPTEFEQGYRTELLRQKLQILVQDGAKVSPAEVRLAWEAERSRVRAAFAVVAPTAAVDTLAVTDADLEAYYKAHPAEFTRPERRRALVALLPATAVPAPAVTDADVEAAYKARRSEFEQPPRRRIAHILVRVPTTGGSAAEDQAKAKAEAALRRIQGGADFAQVAREVSEDPQTAPRGGELGPIAQGEVIPDIDKVAFGMKVGELAGPVRSPFGFHVLKLLEILPGSKRELKDVAPTLRATLAAEGQLKALHDRAEAAQQALLTARDFTAEARGRGLTVREIGPLGKADPVEGIGRVVEATDALFALPVDGVSGAIKVPEGYAVFRLLGIEAAALPPLAEVREDVGRAVRRQKAREQAEEKARQLLAAVQKGDDLRAAARAAGATVGEAGPFSHAEPIADRALGQAIGPVALALPDGGVGGPVPGPGGFYVVKLVARERPADADFEKARTELEARLLRAKQERLWRDWIAALRAPAKVEVNRKILPEG